MEELNNMKSKKLFSAILSLSLMFSGISFCLAKENTRNLDKNAFKAIKTWAENYNKNCTLSDNNVNTKCTFNNGIGLEKFKDGNFKISNSTDTFAKYDGDHVWIYNGKPVFYQFEDGLVNPEKAINLLLNWGNLNNKLKKQLTLPNEKEIMQNQINTNSFWRWWYVPIIGGLAWLANLIYKNYEFYKNQQNSKAQIKPIYYIDSSFLAQSNQTEKTSITQPNEPSQEKESQKEDLSENKSANLSTQDNSNEIKKDLQEVVFKNVI